MAGRKTLALALAVISGRRYWGDLTFDELRHLGMDWVRPDGDDLREAVLRLCEGLILDALCGED